MASRFGVQSYRKLIRTYFYPSLKHLRSGIKKGIGESRE